VQRLFTTFPGGSPGLGLLLLRLAVTTVLVTHGTACLGDPAASLAAWTVCALAVVTGGLLLVGFLTPLSGALASALAAGLAFSVLPSPRTNVFAPDAPTLVLVLVLTAAALALVGPGAFSVDAALFGRREIAFPRTEPRRH
jgi:uncharacterized membrane protein YphA (DoxX/SURF4 family)